MHYKNKEVQPEFFNNIKKNQQSNILKKNLFANFYRSTYSVPLDTLFVIIIAVLMMNLTSFVLGIERGKAVKEATLKKAVPKNVKTNFTAKDVTPTKTVTQAVVEKKEIIEKEVILKAKVLSKENDANKSGYVIQLVTYSSGSNAQQEIENLKAQGLTGYIHQSGKYFIVYSDKYETKVSALKKLDVYKKRYKDCFVKVLKNS